MTKIVYNACYGGFSLSKQGFARYQELGGTVKYSGDIPRIDALLIQVVEELGKGADGGAAKLEVVELPAGTKYVIQEYDGTETVMTPDDFDWQIT